MSVDENREEMSESRRAHFVRVDEKYQKMRVIFLLVVVSLAVGGLTASSTAAQNPMFETQLMTFFILWPFFAIATAAIILVVTSITNRRRH